MRKKTVIIGGVAGGATTAAVFGEKMRVWKLCFWNGVNIFPMPTAGFRIMWAM